LKFTLKNTKHMKVTVVGAGAVGATCADNIARKELCEELVLLDIKEGFAEGKALDLTQTSSLLGFDTKIIGSTNDYSKTAGSDVVVITSGIPRKPGMTREELIGINAGIVKTVTENILKFSPNAIIIIISNPMDTMTYLALKSSGLPKNRIIGMGGILDSARFKTYLSIAMNCSQNDLQATVIGGHGDTTMIPLTRHAQYQSMPVSKFLDAETLAKVSADTMVGGATLTGLLGTSAWYAPGAAGAMLVESIVRDEKKVLPCCVALDGEYGQKDICLGVPVVIGKNGWEKIINMELNEAEQSLFNKSAEAVRNMNSVLSTLSI
jgi:malate dehydrogenase